MTPRNVRRILTGGASAALVLAGAAGALASPAPAQTPAPGTVPATPSGDAIVAVAIGQATPKPADPRSNSSIAAAVARSRATALNRALINAQVQGQTIAAATGLTLGPVTKVSQDTTSGVFYGFYDQLQTRLGPNRFCGRVEKRVVRRRGGTRRVEQRTVKQCYVPPFVTVTLAVTFSATRPS